MTALQMVAPQGGVDGLARVQAPALPPIRGLLTAQLKKLGALLETSCWCLTFFHVFESTEVHDAVITALEHEHQGC
ncbi:MAG: hypothetical protein ABIU87_09930 [Ornithinibacter sp.]